MEIKLAKAELDLIQSAISPAVFASLNYRVDEYDRIFLDVSEELTDEIRDQLSDQLMKIGFNDYYSPNPIGLALESLIDKFYIE